LNSGFTHAKATNVQEVVSGGPELPSPLFLPSYGMGSGLQYCNLVVMILQMVTNRENLTHFQTKLTRLEKFSSVRAELQTAAILSRSCAY
jgi:hypothetical protein